MKQKAMQPESTTQASSNMLATIIPSYIENERHIRESAINIMMVDYEQHIYFLKNRLMYACGTACLFFASSVYLVLKEFIELLR